MNDKTDVPALIELCEQERDRLNAFDDAWAKLTPAQFNDIIAALRQQQEEYERLAESMNVLATIDQELRAEVERLIVQRDNLLCRIHRDGGHYIDKHGIDKAMEDADIKVAETYAELDELRAKDER